jgi:hypothetical protein
MTNLYSIDLKVCATAYIKADNAAEAMEKARKLNRRSVFADGTEIDIPVSEVEYANPDLPEISVAPAMTIHGVWSEIEEKEATVDLAHMGLPVR